MRTLTNTASPRMAALGLIVLVAAMLFAGPLLREVRAQETAPTTVPTTTTAAPEATPTVSVAVVDFRNLTDYPAPGVGRVAADAMALALNQTQRFDAVGRTLVENTMQELRLDVPLSLTAASMLGKELQVAGVVSGEIRQIRILQGSEGRRAEVVMAVQLIDVEAMAVLNGALVRVSGTPKPGFTGDDQVLINEAISLAAYQATQRLLSNRTGVGTVLMVSGNSVEINGGVNLGYLAGMQLVVMRYGERVGLLRLTDVRNTNSTAAIVENPGGVATGDKVTPIYTLPSGTNPAKSFETVVQKREKRSKLSNTLLGVLAGAGLLALLGRQGAGDLPVTGTVSSSLANALSYLSQQSEDQGRLLGGTLTTWTGDANQRDVLAYIIYRNEQIVWVQFPEQGMSFVDPISLPVEVALMFEIEIDEETGAIVQRLVDEATVDTPEGGPGQNRWLLIFRYNLPEPGVSYTYRITKVVRERTFEGGETAEGTTTDTTTTTTAAPRRMKQEVRWVLRESALGDYGGPATAVTPPLTVDPPLGAVVTTPQAAVFTWQGAAGADSYVLQISRTADFAPVNTQQYFISTLVSPTDTVSQQVDLSAAFPSTTAQTLVWRVGAKNSADEVAPRLPGGLSQARPQDAGWVWGNNGSVIINATAAAPPRRTRSGPSQPRVTPPAERLPSGERPAQAPQPAGGK